MAIRIPDNIINTYKSVVDVLALPNEVGKLTATNLGLQHKCLFEMLIYPEVDFSSLTGALNTVASARDTLMARFYIYAINDIPLIGYEYERAGAHQVLKTVAFPDSISFTFLSDQLGMTKEYLRRWSEQIATYNIKTGRYIFNNNQKISKREAIIIPQQTDVIPSGEWIKITGMKLSKISGIGYSHEDGDSEKITVDFSCDNIRLIEAY